MLEIQLNMAVKIFKTIIIVIIIPIMIAATIPAFLVVSLSNLTGFFFRIFAKKKCVACPRKSSLYDKVRAFFVQKREELKQNGRKKQDERYAGE